MQDPIHLTVDTTLTSGRVNMKAYVFVPIGVPGATSGSMFTPVKVEMIASEPELAGLDLLHKTKHSKVRSVEPVPELTKIAEAADKMETMLDIVIKYVILCRISENLNLFAFPGMLSLCWLDKRSQTALWAGPWSTWSSPCPRWTRSSSRRC